MGWFVAFFLWGIFWVGCQGTPSSKRESETRKALSESALLETIPRGKETVSTDSKPMLIAFSRDHCLPCQLMDPWIEDFRVRYADRIDVAVVNIDREPALGSYFRVLSVPFQIYVGSDRKEFSRHVGIATFKQMEKEVSAHLGTN